MTRLLLIAAAGAAGTLARYGLSTWVRGLSSSTFPWGTLVVNAIGCFLFGIVLTLVRERGVIESGTANILMVGFLGAFTTFATFAFESGDFYRSGAMWSMCLNIVLNVILGLALFLAGCWLVRAG
ncbi:MAG: chromosome condensation protein CrcB [Planctomycetes bacterium]|nr:chromosome condensation protein CrcB [Planctomycetota bacterium]MCP4771279.1 chromosome condensation protein CrcB [Planctomycetota bacterium]MCP4861994.1 chromosome condensation protein CrcB [Planctomycetota bacterium]